MVSTGSLCQHCDGCVLVPVLALCCGLESVLNHMHMLTLITIRCQATRLFSVRKETERTWKEQSFRWPLLPVSSVENPRQTAQHGPLSPIHYPPPTTQTEKERWGGGGNRAKEKKLAVDLAILRGFRLPNPFVFFPSD